MSKFVFFTIIDVKPTYVKVYSPKNFRRFKNPVFSGSRGSKTQVLGIESAFFLIYSFKKGGHLNLLKIIGKKGDNLDQYLDNPCYPCPTGDLLVMKSIQNKDRRRVSRVILRRIITFETSVLPTNGRFVSGKPLRGLMINISNGGICFRTKNRLQRSMVLKVSLPVSEISPAAPTLAQVLWVARDPKHKEYRAGLQFII